jgi:NADPH2:quinone reductase
MKAVLMSAPGGPEVLEVGDLEEPRIQAPTQVKVRLKAAGVNPVDTKIRKRGLLGAGPLPAVLGCDGAGVVEAVGAAVEHLEPGDDVWFCNGGLGDDPGNYAQYTVVEGSVARPMPATLTHTEAAAGPLVLITAWEALYDRARLSPGQTALIHAGAGGVGHVAIQLAVQGGARVATTVGSPEKASFARALGAEETILYRDRDFVAAVNVWTAGHGADVVLDTVGPEVFSRSIDCTAPYGDLVTLLEMSQDNLQEARLRNLRLSYTLMLMPMLRDLPDARAHQGDILDHCARLLDAGSLRIHVDQVLSLDNAAEAHRRIEDGHTQGKIVLAID